MLYFIFLVGILCEYFMAEKLFLEIYLLIPEQQHLAVFKWNLDLC